MGLAVRRGDRGAIERDAETAAALVRQEGLCTLVTPDPRLPEAHTVLREGNDVADQPGVSEQALYPPERQEAILRLARDQGRVEVAFLAEMFRVTTETVRRDLTDLQRRRLVRRVHGGAILWSRDSYEPVLTERDAHHSEEKERIAVAAAAELPPEGTVLLDSGSTMARVVQHLPDELALTVVTNSVVIAQLLTPHPTVDVIVLGGDFDKQTLAMVGAPTVTALHEMRVDTLLLGTDGISPEGGLTTPHPAHAAVKRAMVAAARHVIALADSSKFDHDHFLRFAGCDEVDVLVTDSGMDDATVLRFQERGMEVIRA